MRFFSIATNAKPSMSFFLYIILPLFPFLKTVRADIMMACPPHPQDLAREGFCNFGPPRQPMW